jgi:hypothetical protein
MHMSIVSTLRSAALAGHSAIWACACAL